MTDSKAEFLNQVQQALDMAPDEIKQGGVCVMTAATEIIKGVTIYQDQIKPLGELCTYVRDGQCISPEIANSILDGCTVNNTVVAQNRTQIYKALVEPSSCPSKEFVIQEVNKAMRNTANTFLALSAFSSFVFVTIEVSHLCKFWDTIKAARNIAQSSVAKRDKISSTLKTISAEMQKLTATMQAMLNGTKDKQIRIMALCQIDKIRSQLHEVEIDIRNLEVDVDRQKVRLVASRRVGKTSIATNLVMAGTTAANAILLSGAGNPILIGVHVVLIAANLLLTGVNINLYMISKEDLIKVEKQLEEIGTLERERQKMKASFEADAKRCWDLMIKD